MNWIKNDWSNFKTLIGGILIVSLLMDIGISIVDGILYYKFFIYGLGFSVFCVGCQWVFRNNR